MRRPARRAPVPYEVRKARPAFGLDAANVVQSVTLDLPYPPSANRLWGIAQGRMIKTAEYAAWLTEAGYHVATQKPGRIRGPYAMRITAGRPDNRKRDLDNLAKPIGDLLQASRVIENDCDCQRLSMEWVSGLSGVRVSLVATNEVRA